MNPLRVANSALRRSGLSNSPLLRPVPPRILRAHRGNPRWEWPGLASRPSGPPSRAFIAAEARAGRALCKPGFAQYSGRVRREFLQEN